MKRLFLSFILLIAVLLCQAQDINLKAQATEPFILGEIVEVYSSKLSEARKLNIYFPNDYKKEDSRSYPVIYLLDGSKDEDFIHIAGLLQFANYPWVGDAPQAILIGIENVDRKRDFTYPTKNLNDKEAFPTAGSSGVFIEFIEQELQPFIKEYYSNNDTSIIIGQSLGGLLAAEVLFTKPELFSNYIIVSPSLWWDNESLLDRKIPHFKSQKNVFIAVGEAEDDIMIHTAKTLTRKLKEQQARVLVNFESIKDHDHANILHLAVYRGFKRMFSSIEAKQ